MSKFASSIARIAKYRMIRAVIRAIVDGIKEGAANFYNFSKATGDTMVGFQSAMDSTKAAAQTMKNQLGAAFGTLYAQIAPIINNLISIVIQLANVLTMLFARLSGADGWYRAAAGANAAADAAGGAGKAAKEAMRYLAPFDELNRLPDKNDGGGGGGGDGDGGGGGNYEWVPFEEFDIGDGLASIVNTIKNIFNDAAEWIEGVDWQNLASNIVNGISDALGKVDWAGVTQAIARFLGAAIGAVSGFIVGALKDLVSWITNKIYEITHNEDGSRKTGEDIALGILNGIIGGFISIGVWVKDNIFTPFINAFKKAFGIASPAKEMEEPGEMIGLGILEGIKKPFVAIGEWLNQYVLQPIKNFFAENGLDEMTLPIKTDLSGFKLPDLKKFKDSWLKIKSKTATLTTKLKGTATSKFDSLAEKWSTIKTKTANLTTKLNNSIKESTMNWLKDAWSKISSKTAQFTATLKTSNAVQSFINGWQSLKDKALELKVGIVDKVKSAWNAAAKAWNSSPILSPLGTLPLLAKGGMVNSGQIFVARESGPEIVGKFGNQAGVLNNDDIVRSVSEGVAAAIASIKFTLANVPSITGFGGGIDEEAMYRAFRRALGEIDFGKDIKLDGQTIYRAMVRRNRMNTAATGVNAMA